MKKKIVILGGGFGGLQAARRIGRLLKKHRLTDRYQATLIDKNDYHLFTPTLYEIATTSDYIASNSQLRRIVAFPIKEILDGLPIDFSKTTASSIDLSQSDLEFENATRLHYDYLILAPGSQTNYFDIPGLAHYGLPLKTFTDALRIRERILEYAEDPDRPDLRVVIGGGGPTGVEFASEVKALLCETPRVMGGICHSQVTLVNGDRTLLSRFDPRIIAASTKRLTNLDVHIRTNSRIMSVDESQVSLQNGERLPYEILIWTGGVSPNQIMSALPLTKDPSGKRVLVSPHMTCTPNAEMASNSSPVYGIGDAVCSIDQKNNRPVPSVARAAIEQGWIAAHNIIQQILVAEKEIPVARFKSYAPKEYPYILPVGGKFAIAQFGPVIMSGFISWIIKGLVEFNYLLSIFSLRRAVTYWLKGLWIFMRNDRLG